MSDTFHFYQEFIVQDTTAISGSSARASVTIMRFNFRRRASLRSDMREDVTRPFLRSPQSLHHHDLHPTELSLRHHHDLQPTELSLHHHHDLQPTELSLHHHDLQPTELSLHHHHDLQPAELSLHHHHHDLQPAELSLHHDDVQPTEGLHFHFLQIVGQFINTSIASSYGGALVAVTSLFPLGFNCVWELKALSGGQNTPRNTAPGHWHEILTMLAKCGFKSTLLFHRMSELGILAGYSPISAPPLAPPSAPPLAPRPVPPSALQPAAPPAPPPGPPPGSSARPPAVLPAPDQPRSCSCRVARRASFNCVARTFPYLIN
ncbi:hypothetical protein FHG87_016912 [Trinorchestia longiramus]|nr:hypothetical protein FHG87_016912 [Trinorchestia longiramus]